jgi:hypothetical protein
MDEDAREPGLARKAQAAEASEDVADMSLDMSLEDSDDISNEFDLDLALEEDEKAEAAEAEEGLSEEFSLEFDLDDEGSEIKPAASDDSTEVGELGLDLEEDEPALQEKSAEMDLELDLDLETEAAGEGSDALEFDESEEAPAESSEGFDFDLDLEDDEEAVASSESGASEELDFDDLDVASEEEAGGVSDDLDLDLDDTEGETAKSDAETVPGTDREGEPSEDFTDPFDMGIPTDDLDGPSEELEEVGGRGGRKESKPGRKKVAAPLLALLLLALVGGGGYYAYTAGMIPESLQKRVTGWLPSWIVGAPPVGEVAPVETAIRSRYVRNEQAGLLFIVTGQVRNEYSGKRDHIQVLGKLLDDGGKVVRQNVAFAGNTVSDEKLRTLAAEAIEQQLSNRSGENNLNVGVDPGIKLPFMIVFSDLPENLSEFTIQVLDSEPHGEGG